MSCVRVTGLRGGKNKWGMALEFRAQKRKETLILLYFWNLAWLPKKIGVHSKEAQRFWNWHPIFEDDVDLPVIRVNPSAWQIGPFAPFALCYIISGNSCYSQWFSFWGCCLVSQDINIYVLSVPIPLLQAWISNLLKLIKYRSILPVVSIIAFVLEIINGNFSTSAKIFQIFLTKS